MEIGKKIHQFRKLSGISQEQLAEKLNVSRQTISKWETGATLPDIQSIVKFCNIFQVTLNDLLLDEKNTNHTDQITLQDLIQIHIRNRKMTLLLTSGLLFIMASILSAIFIMVLHSVMLRLEYLFYRYITIGEYIYMPINYLSFSIPAILSFIIGISLCICYIIKNKKSKKD